MEDNNFNKENGIEESLKSDTMESQPIPETHTDIQYQSSEFNNDSFTKTTNKPKSKVPLVVFGGILLLTVILVVSLFLENDNNQNGDVIIDANTKTLIVYFSHDGENYGRYIADDNKVNLTVGNTEVMAKKIANYINADLYEIEPLEKYPENLDELFSKTKIEYNKDYYPEIKNRVTDLDSYDVIFIGYPIWHSAYPQIIKTFVKDNEKILKNKIIVPFNTHAGSGSAGTYKKLFNLIGIPNNRGLNGLALNGVEVENSDTIIRNWLESIGYML